VRHPLPRDVVLGHLPRLQHQRAQRADEACVEVEDVSDDVGEQVGKRPVQVDRLLAAPRAVLTREHVTAIGARARELFQGLRSKVEGLQLPGIIRCAPVVPASINQIPLVDGLSGIFMDAAVALGTAIVTWARALAWSLP